MNLKIHQFKLSRQTAVTLMELIAATIVFGIIIVGVTAVDFAMRRSQQSSSQNAILAMRTSSIMLHLTKNAQQATGDGQQDALGNFLNLGIVTDAPVNTTNIWIRMETSGPPAPDPNSYADDIWVNYHFDPNSHVLSFCQVPNTLTTCTAMPNPESLGTLVGLNAQMVTDDSVVNQNFYLEVTLINRFNPAAPADTFENPPYTLTSRIFPLSFSFNN